MDESNETSQICICWCWCVLASSPSVYLLGKPITETSSNMNPSSVFLHDILDSNDLSQESLEVTKVSNQRLCFRRERSLSFEEDEDTFKSVRTETQSNPSFDISRPRRRVAKKSTVSKIIPPSTGNKNLQINQNYTTNDDSYETIPSSTVSNESALNNRQNIGLSRIPDQPVLPTFSTKVQHELVMGNPESIMNELIREAADFYMNVYPQLTHGVEYKKIGIALINEYPCLACDDAINPHGLITSRLSARIRNVRRKMRNREQKCKLRGSIY